MLKEFIFGEEEKEEVHLDEHIERSFIPSSKEHGASGSMAMRSIMHKKDGSKKVWAYPEMFRFRANVQRLPPADLTFGRSEPHEEVQIVKKGEIKFKGRLSKRSTKEDERRRVE